jgi:hypothetical protein
MYLRERRFGTAFAGPSPSVFLDAIAVAPAIRKQLERNFRADGVS